MYVLVGGDDHGTDLLDKTTRHITDKMMRDTQKPKRESERDMHNVFYVRIMNCLLGNT